MTVTVTVTVTVVVVVTYTLTLPMETHTVSCMAAEREEGAMLALRSQGREPAEDTRFVAESSYHEPEARLRELK